MAVAYGFTTSKSNDGVVTAVRTIMSGEATQIDGSEGTVDEDYYPETEEQEISLNPPQAVELAATGDLFSSWDTAKILQDFSENMKENAENQSVGGPAAELKGANDIFEAKQKAFEEDRSAKVEQAKNDALIGDILDLYRIEISQVEIERISFEPESALQDLVKSLSVMALCANQQRRGLSIRC